MDRLHTQYQGDRVPIHVVITEIYKTQSLVPDNVLVHCFIFCENQEQK